MSDLLRSGIDGLIHRGGSLRVPGDTVTRNGQGGRTCARKAICVPSGTSGPSPHPPRRRFLVEAWRSSVTYPTPSRLAARSARDVGRGSAATSDADEHYQGLCEQRAPAPRTARGGETDPTAGAGS